MFSVENQNAVTYLIYTLDEGEELDCVTLGMVSNNTIKGVFPMIYTQMDTVRQVKYNITSKMPLRQFFGGSVKKIWLTDVFLNMCDAAIEVEEYMIDPGMFLWDIDNVYVDISTREIYFVCLPVIKNIELDNLDLCMFFKQIMFSAKFDDTEDCSYVAKIVNYLNEGEGFSVSAFKEVLETLNTETTQVQVKKVVRAPQTEAVSAEGHAEAVPIIQNIVPTSPVSPENNKQHESVSIAKIVERKKQEQAVMTNRAEHQIAVTEQNEKKKKFGSLFSAKKKNKGNDARENFNMAIPGRSENVSFSMPIPESQGTVAVEKEQEHMQTGTGVSNAPLVINNVENSHIQTKPANFGSTTVLNAPKGNSHPTVVLSELNTEKAAHIPYLLRVKNNEKIELIKEKITIGKEADFVDYVIQDNATISRCHAVLFLRGEQAYIMDMNSSNHTYVNGGMITSNQETALHDQDHIKLSNEEFIYMA